MIDVNIDRLLFISMYRDSVLQFRNHEQRGWPNSCITVILATLSATYEKASRIYTGINLSWIVYCLKIVSKMQHRHGHVCNSEAPLWLTMTTKCFSVPVIKIDALHSKETHRPQLRFTGPVHTVQKCIFGDKMCAPKCLITCTWVYKQALVHLKHIEVNVGVWSLRGGLGFFCLNR